MSEFVRVADLSELPPGKLMKATVAGEDVLVANVNGKVYAIGGVCTHRGGPLYEGELDGEVIVCPWHGGRFNLGTGEVVGPPPKKPEPSYDVKLEGNSVLIRKK